MNEFFLIAEIVSVFGPDGSVVLKYFSDFKDHIFDLKRIYIDFYGNKKLLDIDFTDEINGSLIIKFKRFNNSGDVHNLLGKKLYITSEDLNELPEDSFYIHELIGSTVYRDSEFFGKLIDVIIIPDNNVFVIENNKGQQVMIPAAKKYFLQTDIENKKIILSEESKIFDYDEN